jgi:hypothetical protein
VASGSVNSGSSRSISSSIAGTSSHSMRKRAGWLRETVTGTRRPGMRYFSRVIRRYEFTNSGRIPGPLTMTCVVQAHHL